jgi:L-alanine-DL-glutamate epimerase-like enolase superfamily enzyme
MDVSFDWNTVVLEHPFVVAHTVVDTINTLRCTLDAGGCAVGRGVSTFGPWADTAAVLLRRGEAAVAEMLESRTTFTSLSEVATFGVKLLRSGRAPAGLCAAVEMAALDLVCQAAEVPLSELLGTPASAVLPILATVSVGALDTVAASGRMKVKVDNATVDQHLDCLAVLAEESEFIVFDGNRSLDDARFDALASAVAGRGQVFFEDPTATPATWTKIVDMPEPVLIEDESVHCVRTAALALNRGHGINIKALKLGGVLPARDCLAHARDAYPRQPRMLGCFVEEPEMIALSATVCADLAHIVDLDGHLLLASGARVPANEALEVNGSWVGLPTLTPS